MHKLGTTLLYGGAAIGVLVVLAMVGIIPLGGLPWFAAVGLAKLTLLSSAGVMSAGAVCLRLERRAADRKALTPDGIDAAPESQRPH